MTALALETTDLRATVLPDLGGLIASLRHLPTGTELLAQAPWHATRQPTEAATDESDWLSRWPGGWPILFPNAGDGCTDDGTRHGFHGEGSLAGWQAHRDGHSVLLTRSFRTAPAIMTRRLVLTGNRLDVTEVVRAHAPATVIWGQHVTFGSDLLSAPVTLDTSAKRLAACATYDPPANPLIPGATGYWPCLSGRVGPVDLSRPPEGAALLACLVDLGPAPWAVLTTPALTVRLDWSADPWPLAWLWVETGGATDGPWHGKGRMIGIEPCSTWPATGLAAARAAGAPLVMLKVGKTRRAHITLTVTPAT